MKVLICGDRNRTDRAAIGRYVMCGAFLEICAHAGRPSYPS